MLSTDVSKQKKRFKKISINLPNAQSIYFTPQAVFEI